jgi:hypothetical protein
LLNRAEGALFLLDRVDGLKALGFSYIGGSTAFSSTLRHIFWKKSVGSSERSNFFKMPRPGVAL